MKEGRPLGRLAVAFGIALFTAFSTGCGGTTASRCGAGTTLSKNGVCETDGTGGTPHSTEDRTGNEETNTVEATATRGTSFEVDVQPIFTATCAILVCHTTGDGTNPPDQGLNLDPGASYSNIVNVIAREGIQLSVPEPTIKRIDANSTDPNDSYLYRKLVFTGSPNIFGVIMPPPQAQKTLTPEQIQTIADWISEGSLNN